MKRGAIWLYLGGFILVGVAVLGLVTLLTSRASQARAEGNSRREALEKGPRVVVEQVAKSPSTRKVTVQAEARPYATVTLYAKVSGYLRRIDVDKGDRVKKGQLVAVIEAPELDQQTAAALADARNKRVIAKRTQSLLQPGVVSQQDSDVAVANADIADATVASLNSQKGYEVLRAPFDGTVTARYVDPGALVQNAASAQTSAQPVVTISQVNQLRVYGYVDQRDAPFVRTGVPAEIEDPGQPGQVIHATVSRTSDELDPKTRMMLVEVDIDNREQAIVAGSFVDMTLIVPTPSELQIPVQGLVLRGTKPFVGVVSSDNRINFHPVKLAAQDGITARIAEGLTERDRIALNVGDSLIDGSPVQPVAAGGGDGAPTK